MGSLQVLGAAFKGHLEEYRETQADTQSVEAAYASRLYSPDDLTSALTKMTAAGKTAGHDVSAMNGSVVVRMGAALSAAIPERAQAEINSVSDSWNNFFESIHLSSHPSLQHRIENINEQKELHDKGGLKR